MAGWLSHSIAGPLERNDSAAAQLAVNALRENPGLMGAAVMREGGEVLAQFRRTEANPSPPRSRRPRAFTVSGSNW
jgi:hypothetical protein